MNLSKYRAFTIATIALLAFACGGGAAAPSVQVTFVSPATPAPTSTPDRIVTIAAVGDVMIARRIVPLMEQHGELYPFERVLDLLRDADLTVANLENAITDRGLAATKLFTFRTPPRFAGGLAQAGIDVVSLGNNHTADFGREGVEDTLAALDATGVRHAGAGLDEAAARRPAFVEASGLLIAFLSYTTILENTFAGPVSAGVAFADPSVIAADVQSARTQADVVVVSLHGGVEYTDAPTAAQRQLARAAIDAGALLVLGHHPHVLQGWERYGDGLIAYSLGNFVFDFDADDLATLGPAPFQTVVLFVTLDASKVLNVRAEPVFIDPFETRPRPPTGDERAEIEARLDLVNAIVAGQR